MGSTYRISTINTEKLNKLLTPVIFCQKIEKVAHLLNEYEIVSVNEVLAKKLLEIDADKRYLLVTDVLNKILNNFGEPMVIKDFEMLFDPEYQIDVLKFFINLNRTKKIALIWNGKVKDDKLIFAEPGNLDYKSYNIRDYDISCII